MRRVSFDEAKILKEAGYPQWSVEEADNSKLAYDCEGELWEIRYFDQNPQDYYTAPYVIEVWLWLWREKGIRIQIIESGVTTQCYATINNTKDTVLFNSPEEAIIAAIEYLCNNDLIK